jgi:hypothetical protein
MFVDITMLINLIFLSYVEKPGILSLSSDILYANPFLYMPEFMNLF